MNNTVSRSIARIMLLGIFTFVAASSHAQTLVWNGTGTTLNSTASWTPNALPAVGDILQFSMAGGNKAITNDLSAGFNCTLNIVTTGYSFSGNAFGDIFTTGTGTATIANNINSISVNGTVLTLSGNITGVAAGFSVQVGNIATVTLSGNNTYTGKLDVSGNSTLNCGSATALSAAGVLSLSSGTVNLTTFNQTILNGGSVAGTTLNLGSATLTIAQGGDTIANGKFAGQISGTGGVIKQGTGVTQLEFVQYSGATQLTGGTLYMLGGFPGTPGTSDVTVAAGATLRGNGSIRNLTCSGTFFPAPPDFNNASTCRDMTFLPGATYRYEVLDSGSPKVTSTGLVTLANVTPEFVYSATAALSDGAKLIVIDCPPSTPQDGTFNGLAEGDVTLLGTSPFTLNYASASNSFDIVLTKGGTLTKPVITSFTPTTASVGKTVAITGQNLTGASSVTFTGATSTKIAATFSGNTATGINAVVPTGAVTGRIEVTTANGTARSATDITIKKRVTLTLTTTGGGIITASVTGSLKDDNGADVAGTIEFANKLSAGLSYGTAASGQALSLASLTPGDYTIFGLYAGTTEFDSASSSVRILVKAGSSGGNDIVVVDGNGDGLPDKGNPPSGFTPGAAQPDGSLELKSFGASGAVPPAGKISRGFVPNKDSIKFKGVFTVSPGFSSGSGLALIVAVGANGVVKFFTIDSKGKSTPKGNDNFQIIGKPKNGKIAFSASFTRGSFIGDLTDAGYPIGTADLPSASYDLPFGMYANFGTYLATEKTDYSLKAGKFKAKLAKK